MSTNRRRHRDMYFPPERRRHPWLNDIAPAVVVILLILGMMSL